MQCKCRKIIFDFDGNLCIAILIEVEAGSSDQMPAPELNQEETLVPDIIIIS